jgi:hypothetical protein
MEKIKETDNKTRKQNMFEKREYHKHMTRSELNVRDRYLGINQIKTDYQPVTYHFKHNSVNTTVKIKEHAGYAADYLPAVTWSPPPTHPPTSTLPHSNAAPFQKSRARSPQTLPK